MARKPLYTTIDLSGPFFTNDPSKTFRSNARSMMRHLVIEGEKEIKAQLAVSESSRAEISNKVTPVRVSEHVTSGVPFTPGNSKTGAIFAHIYVPNFGYTGKQGRALMAAYSRVEKETGAFRKTTARLKKARAINVEELLKDIA